MIFEYGVQLMGSNGRKTSINFDLGDVLDHTTALASAGALKAALLTVTDATIAQERLSHVIPGSQTIPAAGVDVFEEALVTVHLNPVTSLPKYHNLRIPAPKIALFEAQTGAGRDIISKDNADLQAFVQAIIDEAYVSDGEKPNNTHQYNGIANGKRNIRKMKLGAKNQ